MKYFFKDICNNSNKGNRNALFSDKIRNCISFQFVTLAPRTREQPAFVSRVPERKLLVSASNEERLLVSGSIKDSRLVSTGNKDSLMVKDSAYESLLIRARNRNRKIKCDMQGIRGC